MVSSGKNQVLDLFPPPFFFCFIKQHRLGYLFVYRIQHTKSQDGKNYVLFFKALNSPWLFIYVPCIYDALRCLIMVMKEEEGITELLMKRIEQRGID